MSGEPLSRAQVEELCNGKGELTKQGWRMLLDTDAALRAQLAQVTEQLHCERDVCMTFHSKYEETVTDIRQQLAEAQARIKELEAL